MNKQEQETIKAYTDTLAPVCIGRFQVSMPEQMPVAFSSLTVNDAKIRAKPMSRQMFERFIEKRKVALESTRPLNDEDRPYLKQIINLGSDMLVIDRNQSPHTPDALRTLEGYRFDGLTMFSITLDARDIEGERYKSDRQQVNTNKQSRLQQIKYLLSNLGPREPGDTPSEPGLCFEHGFLAGGAEDKIPGAALPYREESIGMTYVDRERQDIYFHFYIDNSLAEDTTLLDRINDVEKALSKDDDFAILRSGKVDLQGIEQAEEVLAAGTTQQKVRGDYFNLEANSKIGSAQSPYIDISFHNGEFSSQDNQLPIKQASLTDAEAAGLWDAVTRTFRPRPNAF